MQFTDIFSSSIFLGLDCFSIQHCLFTFLGNLILPLVLIVILVGVMGGNMQSMAENIGDVLSSCLVLALDLSLRLFKCCCIALICLLSVAVRMLLSWHGQRRIKLKIGDDPANNDSPKTSNLD